MARLRPCLTCNAMFTGSGSRCPAHSSGTSWNGSRDRQAQAHFRDRVLDIANHQCQWRLKDGEPCGIVRPLEAHHTEPGNDDPATGLALCRFHHRLVDSKAR